MNSRGFTLIEVIIVIAIIAIVSAIAITRVDSDFGYLDSFSKELLYDIRYVRDETMRGKPGYRIKINGDEATGYYYEVRKFNPLTGTEEIEKTLNLKSKFKISYSMPIIKYKADGILDQGAQTIILERRDSSEKIEIVVNNLGNTYTR